jgi:hypothetical protein
LAKNFQITAYGEVKDRQMLQAISDRLGCSQSAFILMKIREEYYKLFGDNAPTGLLDKPRESRSE